MRNMEAEREASMSTRAAPKQSAIWVDCPGMSDPYAHAMRDYCSSCAPWWESIPTCPVHRTKLRQRTTAPRGRWTPDVTGYCRDCRKHYTLFTITAAAAAAKDAGRPA